MNDPLISRFAEDCGADAPLNLRVESNGSVLAEGTVQQPFTLLGRDDSCDVTLTDPEVNLRHAWLQVIGGRPFLIDLGSRTGLVWPTGPRSHGWLDVGTSVSVGPFHFMLRSSPSSQPTTWPIGFNPLRADPETLSTRPAVGLEFRNGRRPRDRWPVNRMITLIGRSPECKIHLNADDIASYHCGLVLTPSGLWVVDLSGRGVVVDGERMRVAPLRNASELWVGRYLIACVYPAAGATPALAVQSPITITPATPMKSPKSPSRDERTYDMTDRPVGRIHHAPVPASNSSVSLDAPTGAASSSGLLSAATLMAGAKAMGDRNQKLAHLLEEDEVQLGVVPLPESGGLPSSHIMADAFETLKQALAERNAAIGSGGPVSGAISLSGTLTPPPVGVAGPNSGPRSGPRSSIHSNSTTGSRSSAPVPVSPSSVQSVPMAEPMAAPPTAVVLPVLKQLGDIHGQMFEQFQQSMLLMVQMFGQMHTKQMSQMEHELSRIQELNTELAKLQAEVARLAMMQALGSNSVAGPSSGSGVLLGGEPSTPRPKKVAHFDSNEISLEGSGDPTAMKNYVVERINALQQERQSRWQKLVGCIAAQNPNPA